LREQDYTTMSRLEEEINRLSVHADCFTDDVKTAITRISSMLDGNWTDLDYNKILHELDKLERFRDLMKRLSYLIEIQKNS
jgi:uncharacterized protein Yka (UPF0111/DUF47 family)